MEASLEELSSKHWTHHGKNKRSTTVATLSFVWENEVTHCDQTACHAGLNSHDFSLQNNRSKEKLPFNLKFVISGIHSPDVPSSLLNHKDVDKDKDRKSFIEYLVSHSPWNNLFPVKDEELLHDNEILMVDASAPSNLLAGSLIAGRALSEWFSVAHLYHRMISTGNVKNKDMAYLIALMGNVCLTPRKGDLVVSYNKGGEGHTAIGSREMSKDSVVTFLNHKPTKELMPYSEEMKYSYVQDTFNKDKGDWFRNNFARILCSKSDKDVSIDTNPFEKAKKEEKASPRFGDRVFCLDEEHLECLVNTCNEMAEEAYK